MNRNSGVLWTLIAVGVAAVGIALALFMQRWRPGSIRIQGTVIRRSDDPRNETPISDAMVTASNGVTSASTQSDASGYFNLNFQAGFRPLRTVDLTIQHPDYQPLNLRLQSSVAGKELHVAALEPSPQQQSGTGQNDPLSIVSNIRIRYTVNSYSEDNIGSAVKTFQVANKGNVACNGQSPCSPDGKWKANTGSINLDAGPSNEFRNVRASCIAGPCPFTRIDLIGADNGARTISASALDWSDTATFLLEAEVFHASMSSSVRDFYPVFFGRTLHFTLPPTEEGVSIEAEINGTPMVFPLGPELYLSWATCTSRASRKGDNGTVYECELKQGYRF